MERVKDIFYSNKYAEKWQGLAFELGIAILIVLSIQLMAASLGLHSGSVCQYDCEWYTRIVNTGYHLFGREHAGLIEEASDDLKNPYAFWPLFPVSAGFIAHLLHVPFILTAQILNSAAWACAAVIMTRLLGITETSEKITAIALFLTFPFGFYAYIPYSESIYGLLLLAFIYAMRSNWIWEAGLIGAIFSMSRPTSVPIIAAIYGLKFFLDFRKNNLRIFPLAGSAAISSIGFFLWIFYQWWSCGDPIEFLHVEAAWGRSYSGVFSSLKETLLPQSWTDGMDSQRLGGLIAILTLPLLLLVAIREKLFYFTTVILVTFYLAYSHGYDSTLRYMLGSSVTIATIAAFLRKIPRPYQYILIGAFFIAQQTLLICWRNISAFLR